MPAKKTVTKKTVVKKPAAKKPTNGKVAAFSLDDVKSILANKKDEGPAANKKIAAKKAAAKHIEEVDEQPREAQAFGVASLSDILGFNPTAPKKEQDETKVPKKWKKYYKLLVELRDHLSDGITLHSRDTIKTSSTDEVGESSSYSQHMADEGTDAFDRDFALSLVSSEQDALSEIEAAINRILDGTYGICELTGDKINEERLKAVPFTRHSLAGQQQEEKNSYFSDTRGGDPTGFGSTIEESTQYMGDDAND